jgi:hypothetical protein
LGGVPESLFRVLHPQPIPNDLGAGGIAPPA